MFYNTTWQNGVNVNKTNIRTGFRDFVAYVVSTVPEAQALVTAGQRCLIVAGIVYYYDAADTTTAHNGSTVIVTASGNRYKTIATLPAASGANLTALNASNLASGTIPDARFPATLPAASGVNLTDLNASQLTTGTIPDARFPATLPAVSGANLTNLDAADLATGTIPNARFPATLPAASGANLTALNASQLTTGTVAPARMGSGTADNTTFLRGDGVWAVPGGGSGSGAAQNLLANSNFRVNQRVQGDAAISAGVFARDRWKAATGGATIVTPTDGLTLSAGAIEQVVFPGEIGIGSLASKSVTLSGIVTQACTVTLGSQSGTLTAGGGGARTSLTLTLGAGDTGNLTLKIDPNTYNCTIQDLKLELGTAATSYIRPSFGTDLEECQREYQKSYEYGTAPGAVTTNGQIRVRDLGFTNKDQVNTRFPVEMRTTPTITWYSPGTGTSNRYRVNTSSDVTPTSTAGTSSKGTGNITQAAGAANDLIDVHFVASTGE